MAPGEMLAIAAKEAGVKMKPWSRPCPIQMWKMSDDGELYEGILDTMDDARLLIKVWQKTMEMQPGVRREP